VVSPTVIQLPRLGWQRLKEWGYLAPIGTAGVNILFATVSEQAGHWYISVQVEQEHVVPDNTGPVVAVDLGVKTLATFSDGTVIANARPLKRRLKKLRRLQRTGSRPPTGSQNRKVAQQRANTLHQVMTRLAKTKAVVVLEDPHMAGMLENHRLAQAISDVGFAEFRRQLTYKAAWYGCRVVVASRWGPSSKTCS